MIRRNLTSGLPLIHLLFAFVTHGADLIDDDGLVHIRGRLTPEAGAVVQRALEAATDQLYRESAQAPAGDRVQDEVTAGQRRADALVRVAECALGT